MQATPLTLPKPVGDVFSRLLAYPGSVWEEVPAEKAPASADAKAAPAKTK